MPANNLYAIKSPRTVAASAFQGTWTMKRPRVTDAVNKDAEIESSESVSISIADDRKVVDPRRRHREATSRRRAARARRSGAAASARSRPASLQSFTGMLDNGVILAFPDKDAEDVGADAGYCKPEHKRDRIIVVKLEGDQLTFYPHRRQRVPRDDPADARYGAACRIQRHLNVRCTRTSHGYPIDT